MVPLSILDLAPIVEGSDAAAAFRNTLDLARHAERWGYRAPGTDPTTAAALRRGDLEASDAFPQDVMELIARPAG